MNIFIKKPKSKRFIPKHSYMCYNKGVWNVYDSVNKKNVHNNHININSGMEALNECDKLNRIEDNKTIECMASKPRTTIDINHTL